MKVLVLSLLSCLLVFGNDLSDLDFVMNGGYKTQYESCKEDTNNLRKQIKMRDKIIRTMEKKLTILERRYKQIKKQPKQPKSFEKEISVVKFTKARAYKLLNDANIYDKDGYKMARWEKGISFTSNQQAGVFTKITGYFEDKKWKPSDVDMWIETKNIIVK